MANNLFVAYDLMQPGQNYDAVRERIMELGRFQQFQYSLFYLSTVLTPREVYDYVREVMDDNDRLIVIDAVGGVVSSPQWVVDAVNRVWFNPTLPAPIPTPQLR